MTITEFLNARYDEEWELASGAMTDRSGIVYDHARFQDEFESHDGESTAEQRAFVNHFDPRRTFDDITAKRAIVARETAPVRVKYGNPVAVHTSEGDMYWDEEQRQPLTSEEKAQWWEEWTEPITDTPVLRMLAQPYAEHAEFDPTWRTT